MDDPGLDCNTDVEPDNENDAGSQSLISCASFFFVCLFYSFLFFIYLFFFYFILFLLFICISFILFFLFVVNFVIH